MIREQDWPHETVNSILAGKKFDVNDITEKAFVAGIVNSIVESEEFRKLEKGEKCPVMLQKLKILNKLVHTLIRSENFQEAKEFYYSILQEIEVAEASWKDGSYWEKKLSLFRSLARPSSSSSRQAPEEAQVQGKSHNFIRTEGICRRWNEQRCEESSPHMLNGMKVFHLCQYSFKRNPIILEDHPADVCPKKPPGYVRGQS